MFAAAALALSIAGAVAPAPPPAWATVPARADFATLLAYDDTQGRVNVPAFEAMTTPVTNAQFLDFVRRHPQWRRDRVPAVFADTRYLAHWESADALGDGARDAQPVVAVSWFAAQAYCEAQHARLPTWSEWERMAAADEQREDARQDPAWRLRILSWYGTPSTAALADVGQSAPTLHGVHDLHGLVWEWVDDFSSLLVSGDNREQGDPDRLQFCGAAGLSTEDRENYAVLMRVAMLSSLEAASTTVNLGFRCARDLPEMP